MDKQAYIKSNNAIQGDAAKAFATLDVTKPASVKAAQAKLDGAADKLAALKVPSDYAKPHADMIASLRELSTVLTEAEHAILSHNTAKLTVATKKMQASQAKFNHAVAEMNANRT